MVKPIYKKLRNIHMIGIGGTGMSGIAEVLLNLGYIVSGTDIAANEATRRLKRLGAKVDIGHKAERVKGYAMIFLQSCTVIKLKKLQAISWKSGTRSFTTMLHLMTLLSARPIWHS